MSKNNLPNTKIMNDVQSNSVILKSTGPETFVSNKRMLIITEFVPTGLMYVVNLAIRTQLESLKSSGRYNRVLYK